MTLNRVTEGVNFNTGISMAEYNDAPAGQTPGQTQKSILPGSTTVSEALATVFPKDPTVGATVFGMLAQAGNSTVLRTSSGFHAAAKKAIGSLRRKGAQSASAAADELEGLLADTELLDFYRASLLET